MEFVLSEFEFFVPGSCLFRSVLVQAPQAIQAAQVKPVFRSEERRPVGSNVRRGVR
jgi:hypothetical protein